MTSQLTPLNEHDNATRWALRVKALLLCAVALICGCGEERWPPPPDFSGTWVVDEESYRSDTVPVSEFRDLRLILRADGRCSLVKWPPMYAESVHLDGRLRVNSEDDPVADELTGTWTIDRDQENGYLRLAFRLDTPLNWLPNGGDGEGLALPRGYRIRLFPANTVAGFLYLRRAGPAPDVP